LTVPRGAFALIFKSRHYPDELVAAKRGSPLLLGIVEQDGMNGPEHAMLTSEVGGCGNTLPAS
jgi:glucosamine--fructose-6-phosphate aminotransferase (isomerizing)